MKRSQLASLCLGSAVSVALAIGACSHNDKTSTGTTTSGTSSGGAGVGGAQASAGSFASGTSGTSMTLDVEPAPLQTLTVPIGATTPTVSYTATINGSPANAGWQIDRGDIATINPGPASMSVFAPKGTTGGLVSVTAGANGATAKRQVFVKLSGMQNGSKPLDPKEQLQIPANVGALKAGGGVGGVGGEGLGGPVTDPATLNALGSPMPPAQGLGLLYPYDKTVWPRGMLAPLLMWKWVPNDADAIQIHLETASGSFSWTGTFGRPPILMQTGGPFIRHPIPEDVWEMATNSAGGVTMSGAPNTLTMSLVVAKGGVGYGPISETWRVAPGRLTGSVYYNSYGTQLVKNWAALDGAGHSVGAAILGVRTDSVAPSLVVGLNSPTNAQGNPANDSGCRVCHVVASRGRWLLTQSEQGNPGDGRSFLYDLTAPNVQMSVVQIPQEGIFGWAAMVGDGSNALTNTINPSSTNPAIGQATSGFWQFGAAPTMGTLTGLPGGVAAGYPSYSPDDKFIAYVDATGSTANVHGPIVAAAYDAASKTFSNPHPLVPAPMAGQRIGYPVYLPDNSGVLYETQVRTSQSDSVIVTRNGARSELWWVNTNGTAMPVPLATLNGKSAGMPYIPIGPNNHGIPGASDPQSSYNETGFDDTTLNYEPTVLPIVSGGYAWVVFTSRREYGNMLTAVPWKSWPPSYDTTDLAQATVKKLWVAAINLNAPPGTDPSGPAFYLPAQEILAGNSRGFWVLDPCKADGTSCESGDQCCNGYCEPNPMQQLVCSNTPPATCAGVQDKCTTAADCCDTTNLCINGFCAFPPPPQ